MFINKRRDRERAIEEEGEKIETKRTTSFSFICCLFSIGSSVGGGARCCVRGQRMRSTTAYTERGRQRGNIQTKRIDRNCFGEI